MTSLNTTGIDSLQSEEPDAPPEVLEDDVSLPALAKVSLKSGGGLREVSAGALLDMVVLANGPVWVGVDVASRAFVRPSWASTSASVPLLSVVRGRIGDGGGEPDPASPESVLLSGAPEIAGELPLRQARRLLRGIVAPMGLPPLGFAGPSIAYSTLGVERGSVCVLPLQRGLVLRSDSEGGLRARFNWAGSEQELPVVDRGLKQALSVPRRPLRGSGIDKALGWRPRYLVVALASPLRGYCAKVVASVLPEP